MVKTIPFPKQVTRATLLSPKMWRVPFLERVQLGLSWLREHYGVAQIEGSQDRRAIVDAWRQRMEEEGEEDEDFRSPKDFQWFALNPPAPESEVSAFEREHGISLPADYRDFITKLGNGGAGGDGFGINALGWTCSNPENEGAERWRPDEQVVGTLRLPFPFKKNFNLTKKELDKLDEDEALAANYYRALHGAIPLCDAGCGSYFWLLVTGPQAGAVWHDRRADRGGVIRKGASFSTWYLDWLDVTIANAPDEPLRWDL